MGRPPKFDRGDMVRAALRLVSDRGPRAVTMAAVAREVGAPTGSIYHRYDSREALLAELWMDVVEDFQDGFEERLARASDVEGAVRAAVFMAAWARDHMMQARLLLLHRRQDFVPGDWPAGLVQRAASLEPQLGRALRAFGKRAFGRADGEVMARLRFGLLDAPFGGVKPYVLAGKAPPRIFDLLVGATVRAVLGGIVS